MRPAWIKIEVWGRYNDMTGEEARLKLHPPPWPVACLRPGPPLPASTPELKLGKLRDKSLTLTREEKAGDQIERRRRGRIG